jgi:hypothetical protein
MDRNGLHRFSLFGPRGGRIDVHAGIFNDSIHPQSPAARLGHNHASVSTPRGNNARRRISQA